MKSKKLYALVIVAIISACSPINQTYTIDGKPKTVSFSVTADEIKKVSDSSIVKADNAFGLKLFTDLAKEQKNDNIFISPTSIALGLQMAYNGADADTKDEMAKALEIDKLSLEEVNSLSQLLIKKMNNPASDITLKVANSIWGGKGRITFKDQFKSDLTKFYNAESAELDFSDPATVTKINNWASQNTNGKIPKVIDSISDDVVAYLMNAVYFKADWTKKFDKSQTQSREFTTADGTKKNVAMMSDFRSFKYFNNKRSANPEQIDSSLAFEGAELTYGKEGKVSLIMLLPDSQSSLEKFYSQLNEENMTKWLKEFYPTEGYISFPKFKNEWKKELKGNLANLGMKKAFSENEANFTKMGSSQQGNIYISRVLHNTFIDVNEEGSEAAAVTTVESAASSSAPATRFVADRPFVYMIRDNDTKSILFMGTVNDPKY